MTKRFFVILIASLVVTSMTACGNNAAATSTSAPETTEQYVESQGEGPVQGGIKSDEEIAALQAEEAEYASEETTDTTEYAENVDNTGHEPEAYGSGNFQDYWQSDSYFDLEGYVKANGCTINGIDSNGNFTNDNSQITRYMITYSNKWEIWPSIGCMVRTLDGTTSYLVKDSSVDQPMISVSKNNSAVLSLETVQNIDTIIQCISSNPDSTDPFNGSSLHYSQY